MGKNTVEIANEIDNAKSWEDLDKIIEELERKTFGDKLVELCVKYKKKTTDLQKEVAISKSLFYDVLRDVKNPGKETVIKIGLTLGVSIEELNELLKLAHHKELYPKNREDAVILFALKNHTDIYELNDLLKKYGSKLHLIDKEE